MTEDESTKAAVGYTSWDMALEAQKRNAHPDYIIRLFKKAASDAIAQAFAATQRVSQLESANAWRGIESAPKDGTRIIMLWDGNVVTGKWLDSSKSSHPWQGWSPDSIQTTKTRNPTLWQEFPTPPSTHEVG